VFLLAANAEDFSWSTRPFRFFNAAPMKRVQVPPQKQAYIGLEGPQAIASPVANGVRANTEEGLDFRLGVEPIGARLAQEAPASVGPGFGLPERAHEFCSRKLLS